jgi:hypothetical protein
MWIPLFTFKCKPVTLQPNFVIIPYILRGTEAHNILVPLFFVTLSPNNGIRDNSLDVVTRICPGWPRKGGSNADKGNKFSFVLKHKYWFLETRSLLLGGQLWLFPWVWISRCVKTTVPCNLLLNLRIGGAILPLSVCFDGLMLNASEGHLNSLTLHPLCNLNIISLQNLTFAGLEMCAASK